METIELFGETLRYDAGNSGSNRLIWQGPTIGLAAWRDDAAARWSLSVDGSDVFHATYGHETASDAAHHLATTLMAEIEDRAQVARRLLAGINAELKGGEA